MAANPDPTSPDIENMDPEKEARQLLNPASDSVREEIVPRPSIVFIILMIVYVSLIAASKI